MAENKLYEVTRKHPNKNSSFDLSVGAEYYKNGQTVSRNIFIQAYGNEKAADFAIKDMKDSGWIKDFKDEEKKPAEPEKTAETKTRGRPKK